MDPPAHDGFCRELSIEGGEPIVASAVADTWVWLALEYTAAWGARAYDEAELPPPVREKMDGWLRDVPGTRIQLVRREGRVPFEDITFFVGWSAPKRSTVVELRLRSYENLLDIDLPELVAGMQRGDVTGAVISPEKPMLLVCTNGKRDRCCAKWGVPLYHALMKRDDVDVWQTTHLGGHRFAATVLALPEGLSYGRVQTEEIDELVDAVIHRRIHRLDRFRGRTCHPAAGMAAEHFVREETGRLEVDAIDAIRVREDGDLHTASVRDDNGREYLVELTYETSDVMAPPSCAKAPAPIGRWTCASIRAR
jgi:hypothetical protein